METNRKLDQLVKCALCGSDDQIRKSHIIPEFFYAQLYDSIHRFHSIQTDPEVPEALKQKGLYEKLLCDRCENKFSVLEKYAKETLFYGVGIKIERRGNIYNLHGIDYKKFRLFLLSLLWRMGASKLEFFSSVQLGDKHEKALRCALLNDDPLDPLQYPCLMMALNLNGNFHPDWILQPIHTRSNGKNSYCVVISGILFCFYVTSNHFPSSFSKLCINKSNEMRIEITESSEIPFVREFVSKLSSASRARKHRVKI